LLKTPQLSAAVGSSYSSAEPCCAASIQFGTVIARPSFVQRNADVKKPKKPSSKRSRSDPATSRLSRDFYVLRIGLIVLSAELLAFTLIKVGMAPFWSLAIACTTGIVVLTWRAILSCVDRTLSSARRIVSLAIRRLGDRQTYQIRRRTLFFLILLLVAPFLAATADSFLPRPSGQNGSYWTIRVSATVSAIFAGWVLVLALRVWRRHHFRFGTRILLLVFIPVALLASVVSWLLDTRHDRLYHTSLRDAVAEFNSNAVFNPVGKTRTPLTEQEVVRAIRNSLPTLPEPYRTKYARIARSGYLPQDAGLSSFTSYTRKTGEMVTVWWVNLEVPWGPGSNCGFGLRVREENNLPYDPPIAPTK
jgi:hypothetical protein